MLLLTGFLTSYLPSESFAGHTPTDSQKSEDYKNSWGADHIEADKVLMKNFIKSKYLGKGIKVAILDTGIDYNNPQIKVSYKGGYDFVARDNDPMDEDPGSHGTFIAGIIAANFDNSNVVGVAPPVISSFNLFPIKSTVDLYALRITPTTSSPAQPTRFCDALNWAVRNDIKIAVFSFGGPGYFKFVEDCVKEAYNRGLLLIGASGNDNSQVNFPAYLDEVIAVGATDKNDKRWISSSAGRGSNYGEALDLVAPGDAIKSTIRTATAKYNDDILSGTSFASPYVAGVAALIMSYGIATTNTGVREVLISSADDLGVPGKDNEYGYGLVDAEGAVLPFAPTYLELDPISMTEAGKPVAITGRLDTTYVPPSANSKLATHCSEPCRYLSDKTITITFIGTGTLPISLRTDVRGIFSATFQTPPNPGEWVIQAHYEGGDNGAVNYGRSSVIRNLVTTSTSTTTPSQVEQPHPKIALSCPEDQDYDPLTRTCIPQEDPGLDAEEPLTLTDPEKLIPLEEEQPPLAPEEEPLPVEEQQLPPTSPTSEKLADDQITDDNISDGGTGIGIGEGEGEGGTPTTTSVSISNNVFDPPEVQIKVGDTVEWTNIDSTIHSVTSGSSGQGDAGQLFDSSLISAGGSFTHTFEIPGTFEYHCTLHPEEIGTVIVS